MHYMCTVSMTTIPLFHYSVFRYSAVLYSVFEDSRVVHSSDHAICMCAMCGAGI